MKTLTLSLIALLFPAICVFSQGNFEREFISKVDAFAGTGMSFLWGGDPVGTNQYQKRHLKFSYCFGLEFTHDLNDKWSISALPLYERKGVVYKRPSLHFNQATQSYETRISRYEHDFTNFTLPLLANLSGGEKSNFTLSAGPYLSYLSKQVVQSLITGTRGFTDETYLNRNFEVGVLLRCGYRIKLNHYFILTPSVANLCGLTSIRTPTAYSTRSNVTYFQLLVTVKQ